MYCRFASRKTTFKFSWFSQESDCTDFKTPTNRGFCAMFTPKLPIQFHEHVNETVCISNLYIYIHCITVWKTEFNRLPNRKSCFLVCATPEKNSRCTFGVKEEESLHEKYRAAFAKLEVLFVNGDVRSGCCATTILKKQDAGWMIRQDDWRWLDVDFSEYVNYIFVCMFGRYFFEGWG